MEINKPQAAVFEQYKQFRSMPPTYGFFVRKSLARYLVFGTAAAVSAAIGIALNFHLLTGFVVGAFYTLLVLDESNFRTFRRLWPALEAVIAWDRVDDLLERRRHRIAKPESIEGASPG